MAMTVELDMGWTLLMKAAYDGSASQVKTRMGLGDKINDRDKTGGSALHLAVLQNHPPLVFLLLELGADPLLKNHDGKTPRDVAFTKGYIDLMVHLEKAEKEGRKIKPEDLPAHVAELEKTVAELKEQMKEMMAFVEKKTRKKPKPVPQEKPPALLKITKDPLHGA